MPFFCYPPAALFGRTLPKNKIYERASVTPRLRQLFVEQVDAIIWQYKLAPKTINLRPTAAVPEIQIFRIRLRGSELAADILHCLDTAIPSPLLFELEWEERVQVRACFKQATAPEKAGGYFCSSWHEAGTPRRPLPLVLDMEALYAALLEPLAPWPRREHEALPHWMQRLEAIADCERQMARLEARLRREKQFNKKIPLNRELREACRALEVLKANEEPPCKN